MFHFLNLFHNYLIAYILNLIVAGIIAYSDPVYIIFSQLKDEERLKRKIVFFIAGTAMSAVIAYVFERGIVYAAGYSYVTTVLDVVVSNSKCLCSITLVYLTSFPV